MTVMVEIVRPVLFIELVSQIDDLVLLVEGDEKFFLLEEDAELEPGCW
jgi:hypothetical protein